MEVLLPLIAQQLEAKIEDRDQALVKNRFSILAICIRISNERATITQGLGQLAAASVGCIFHTLYHLTATGPLIIPEDIYRDYCKVVPHRTLFTGLPFHHKMIMVHAFIIGEWSSRYMWCNEDRPSDHEHIRFAQGIAELAWVIYQQHQNVPSWIFGFTFNSLFLDPLPSPSIVANCLKVIAISLGCDVSHVADLEQR